MLIDLVMINFKKFVLKFCDNLENDYPYFVVSFPYHIKPSSEFL